MIPILECHTSGEFVVQSQLIYGRARKGFSKPERVNPTLTPGLGCTVKHISLGHGFGFGLSLVGWVLLGVMSCGLCCVGLYLF